MKDLNEPSVSIPGDSSSYFAPISPAANTGANATSKSINIMEMLQKGKQNEAGASKSRKCFFLKNVLHTNMYFFNCLEVSGRIMSLNELEAKMRQISEPQMHKHPQKSEEDMTAFNRLVGILIENYSFGLNVFFFFSVVGSYFCWKSFINS